MSPLLAGLVFVLNVSHALARYSAADARRRTDLALLDRAPVDAIVDFVTQSIAALGPEEHHHTCLTTKLSAHPDDNRYVIVQTESPHPLDESLRKGASDERFLALVKTELEALGYRVVSLGFTAYDVITAPCPGLAYCASRVTPHAHVCW